MYSEAICRGAIVLSIPSIMAVMSIGVSVDIAERSAKSVTPPTCFPLGTQHTQSDPLVCIVCHAVLVATSTQISMYLRT